MNTYKYLCIYIYTHQYMYVCTFWTAPSMVAKNKLDTFKARTDHTLCTYQISADDGRLRNFRLSSNSFATTARMLPAKSIEPRRECCGMSPRMVLGQWWPHSGWLMTYGGFSVWGTQPLAGFWLEMIDWGYPILRNTYYRSSIVVCEDVNVICIGYRHFLWGYPRSFCIIVIVG